MYEQGLSTGLALILGLLGAGALLLSALRFRFALLLVAGMLLASALGVPLDYEKNVIRQWILPLQAGRSEMYLGASAMLIASAMVHVARLSIRNIGGPGLMMLVIAYYAGMVMLASGFAEDGLKSMAFATLTIPPLLVVMSSILRSFDGVYGCLRVVSLTSAVWTACVAMQFVIDWKKLVVQHGLSRFHGLLPNPQHAAAYTSVCAIVSLFLLFNDPKQRFKPLWMALAGINGIFVLWTGSRTGLGMLGLGLMAVLYARVGRAILFLPLVGLVAMVLFDFLSAARIEFDFEGIMGRGNTRSGAWNRLIEEIASNPLLGVGIPKDIPSENSFLFGMASYGVGMGAVMLLTVLACAVQSLRLWRARRVLPTRERRLTELIVGFYAMYFGGAIFEGYMISRVSTSLIFMLLFSTFGAAVIQLSRSQGAEHEPGEGVFTQHEGAEGNASWYDEEEHAPPDSAGALPPAPA